LFRVKPGSGHFYQEAEALPDKKLGLASMGIKACRIQPESPCWIAMAWTRPMDSKFQGRQEAFSGSWPVIRATHGVGALRPVARGMVVIFAVVAKEFGGAAKTQPPGLNLILEAFEPVHDFLP